MTVRTGRRRGQATLPPALLRAPLITAAILLGVALAIAAPAHGRQAATPPTQTPPTQSPPETPADTPPDSTPNTTPNTPPAAAAATPPVTDDSVPTVDAVTAHKQTLEAIEQPDDATRQALVLSDEALASLARAKQARDDADRFERERLAAATERQEVQDELARTPVTTPEVPEGATLEQLKALRDQTEAASQQSRDKIRELQAERERRDTRRSEIPALREATRSELERIQASIAALPADDPPALSTSRRYALLAKKRALEVQLEAFDRELANYDERRDLLPLRQERWSRRQVTSDALVTAWREIVNRKEAAKAEEELKVARATRAQSDPAVLELAEQIESLRERMTGPDGPIQGRKTAEQKHEELQKTLGNVEERFRFSLQRARASTISEVVDVRLRSERSQLPDLRVRRREVRDRRSEISRLQVDIADLEFERTNLPPITVERDRILSELDPAINDQLRREIETQAEQRLSEQRAAYQALISALREHLEQLLRNQELDRRLVAVTGAYREFINERILWIRSAAPVRTSDARRAWESLTPWVEPARWKRIFENLQKDARQRPVTYAVALLSLIGLVVSRRLLRRRLKTRAEHVRRFRTDAMTHTWAALTFTTVLAATWPAVLWFIAWRMRLQENAPTVDKSLATGLESAAWVLLLLEMLRVSGSEFGLAAAHLRWPKRSLGSWRRHARWLMPILVPLVLLVATLEAQSNGSGEDPLSRVFYVIAMVVVAVFGFSIFRTDGPVLSDFLAKRKGGWIDRLRFAWRPLILLVPIAFALLSLWGYHYTALSLSRSLIASAWLVLLLMLGHGLVLRWLLLARRRLSLEEARRKRDAAREGVREGPAPEAGELAATDEAARNITTIDTQARQLVRAVFTIAFLAGLWLVWAQMLPALSVLDRVEIWPNPGVKPDLGASVEPEVLNVVTSADAEPASSPAATPSADTADGTAATPSESILVPGTSASSRRPAEASAAGGSMTLSDLLVAIIILIVTIVFGRNIPGILEITILQRLPLEPGGKYAITTLARYAITIVGFLLAFSAIGIGWSKVQWLAAAITVGLGFGLQEIFANFVSGIIILFERPIRVGDVVTVGNVSGTVSRIRMRAATITDWDRKELIIPNKEFVTGQVINWALTDTILRIAFPVGIAYGSDTKRAREILLEVAKAHADVLVDPAPSTFLTGFGDSSVDFQLRVFVANPDYFMKVRHDLIEAVHERFAEAGIEISFPQRDLHIRTIEPAISVVTSSGSSKE